MGQPGGPTDAAMPLLNRSLLSPKPTIWTASHVFGNAFATEHKQPGGFDSAQQRSRRLPFQPLAIRQVCAPRQESIAGLLVVKRSLDLAPASGRPALRGMSTLSFDAQ